MSSPRILIIKMSSIGDVVHALPALATLRNRYPKADIAWVVEEKSYDILVNNLYLNQVILFDRKKIVKLFKSGHWLQGWTELRKLRKKLTSPRFDISIDLQGLARSAIIVFLARAKQRIGCYGMRELSNLFSTPPKSGNPNAHAVDRSLQVIQSLDKNIETILEFPIAIAEPEIRFADEFWNQNQVSDSDTIIGINLGASHPLKLWPQDKFIALIDQLQQENKFRVILFGASADTAFADRICIALKTQPINAVGKTTLRQLAVLAKRCAVFVSGDTGSLHIAAAVGTPVVALFGPDDPNKTGPYTDKKIIIWKELECSPCSNIKTCDHAQDCMQKITTDEVITAITALLSSQ
jgi:heptosyltransferase I